MKLRWWIGLVAVVMLVVVWLILSLVPAPNPIGPKEIAALSHQGAQGVPKLIRILRTRDSVLEKINQYIWPQIPSWFPVQIPDPNQTTRNRVAAANVLGRMREKAKPAIPALIVALGDRGSDVSITAAMALRNLGPLAVPALRDAVTSTDEQVRDRAGLVLQGSLPVARTGP